MAPMLLPPPPPLLPPPLPPPPPPQVEEPPAVPALTHVEESDCQRQEDIETHTEHSHGMFGGHSRQSHTCGVLVGLGDPGESDVVVVVVVVVAVVAEGEGKGLLEGLMLLERLWLTEALGRGDVEVALLLD